jgi:3-dehydroquinate dehydratase
MERAYPDSEFQYFTFHHEVARAVDFTLERERVKSAISRTAAERRGSSFYDALIEALGEIHRAKYRRQVIILITDGADQHSKHTLDEVVEAVQTAEAEVFMIGYFNREEDTVFRESGKTVTLISGQEVDNPRFSFKRLAEESGVRMLFPAIGIRVSRRHRSNFQRHREPIHTGLLRTGSIQP